MNKGDLITAIADDAELTKADAERAVNAFITNITASLKKGNKVTIPGFLTVSTGKRAARNGRNPRTGEVIKISARNVVKFKPGKSLSDAVN